MQEMHDYNKEMQISILQGASSASQKMQEAIYNNMRFVQRMRARGKSMSDDPFDLHITHAMLIKIIVDNARQIGLVGPEINLAIAHGSLFCTLGYLKRIPNFEERILGGSVTPTDLEDIVFDLNKNFGLRYSVEEGHKILKKIITTNHQRSQA